MKRTPNHMENLKLKEKSETITSVTHVSQRSYKLNETHMIKVPPPLPSISTSPTSNADPATTPKPTTISTASTTTMRRIGNDRDSSTRIRCVRT